MDINDLLGKFESAPNKWGKKEIEKWLDLINMAEYKSVFETNKIDGLTIFDIEDDEMVSLLNIKNSIHRKRLRKAISILSQLQAEVSEPKYLSSKNIMADSFWNLSPLSQSKLGGLSFKSEVSSSLKNNSSWLQRSNTPTEQSDNVFVKQALTCLDQMSEETLVEKNADLKGKMEEQKLEPLVNKSPIKDRSIRKKAFDRGKPYKSFNKISSPQKTDEEKEFNADKLRLENLTDSRKGLSPEIKGQMVQKETGSMELIIQPIDGVQTNNFYCLTESGGRIGRHSNNEIVILEESVSRHHSRVDFSEGRFYLTDTGSTTGTFIKIEAALQLQEGLILELGSNQFLIEQINCISEAEGEINLKIIEGMHTGREINIINSVTFGRKASNSNSIAFTDDFHLSNNHAKIDYIEGVFMLEDMGSTNGSWLRLSPEGKKSAPYELVENMVFKIGASSTYKIKRSHTSYIEAANRENDGTANCGVCRENDRDVVFMPCKHNVVCSQCSHNIRVCPICEIKVTNSLKIYRS